MLITWLFKNDNGQFASSAHTRNDDRERFNDNSRLAEAKVIE